MLAALYLPNGDSRKFLLLAVGLLLGIPSWLLIRRNEPPLSFNVCRFEDDNLQNENRITRQEIEKAVESLHGFSASEHDGTMLINIEALSSKVFVEDGRIIGEYKHVKNWKPVFDVLSELASRIPGTVILDEAGDLCWPNSNG